MVSAKPIFGTQNSTWALKCQTHTKSHVGWGEREICTKNYMTKQKKNIALGSIAPLLEVVRLCSFWGTKISLTLRFSPNHWSCPLLYKNHPGRLHTQTTACPNPYNNAAWSNCIFFFWNKILYLLKKSIQGTLMYSTGTLHILLNLLTLKILLDD